MATASIPPVRLAKIIAKAGVCSRRQAEALIAAGRVQVNGEVQLSPAVSYTPEEATILIDGTPLPQQQSAKIFAYYKPVGVICTASDPQGRKTVFDALPKNLPRLMLVGRLDLNSEGLLLLTTDGALAGELMHPKNQLDRVYKIRFRGTLTPNIQAQMAKGVTVQGVHYQPFTFKKSTAPTLSTGANAWVEISLKEGKNREIRKVFEHFGLQVNRLIRLSYGGIGLGGLTLGQWRELTQKEAQTLRQSLAKTSSKINI